MVPVVLAKDPLADGDKAILVDTLRNSTSQCTISLAVGVSPCPKHIGVSISTGFGGPVFTQQNTLSFLNVSDGSVSCQTIREFLEACLRPSER